MYFPLLILHSWGKRSAVQPQAIYSEVPKMSVVALYSRFMGLSKQIPALFRPVDSLKMPPWLGAFC